MPKKPSLQSILVTKTQELCDQAKDQLKKAKNAAVYASAFNAQKGNYTVHINSCWEQEGETSTKTNHIGKLADAVEAAEKQFLETNKRAHIDARYFVTVRLGELDITVPEEYWKDYKRKN